MGTGGSSLGVKRGWGMMLLVPRLRKSKSYTSSHPKVPLWSVTRPLNKLPECITDLVMDKKHFILALKRFLIIQSFYSINEFFRLSR
jgi:hypothetical protein